MKVDILDILDIFFSSCLFGIILFLRFALKMYTPKELLFNEDGRTKLKSGIAKISSAVKSTLGPRGNTVLIESENHLHGITVTKDGVTVAKAVDLIDPTENLAVRIMKEAAERTATSAGDGTTSSIVLTEALVNRADGEILTQEVFDHMVSGTKEVVKMLRSKSKRVTKSKLRDVATISANNDAVIGKTIAEVYKQVGKDGVVTVERSQTSSTHFETTSGIKVDRGYSSPMFINDQRKDECVLDDVYVMVSDAEITNILQIENVLKPIIQKGLKLLIVAPCSGNVLNTLAANVVKKGLKICVVQPPSFGYKQHELMQDIAVSVGANYFSEKTGDDLSIIDFSDLGHASKIIAGKSATVIVKEEHENQELVDQRISELRMAHAEAKQDKDFILSRIASLSGGIGVIYVGGNTDLEQKELYDRVDDAVCAVRSALEEGILPGGGNALLWASHQLDVNKDDDPAKKIAYAILKDAIKAPVKQILENADIDYEAYYSEDLQFGHGLNVKTEQVGDLMKMGVIDPLKVTRCALENAVSVAVTILSTNAIITMAREIETKN